MRRLKRLLKAGIIKMGQALPPRTFRGGDFTATLPRTGEDDGFAFRIRNMVQRGHARRYYEVFQGSKDLSENVPLVALTGTIDCTQGDPIITGTGTIFTVECHLGQYIILIDEDADSSALLVVKRIISDISMEVWQGQNEAQPTASFSGVTGWRMSVIFAVNDQRGTALRGNVLKLDKGTLLSVGDGTFRLNGTELSGSSLSLTREPQISIYDATDGTYDNYTLGMDTPTGISAAAVSGGTKDMQAGNYSMVFTPARLATGGYNNPSARVDVTITTGDAVEVTFGTADTAHGQDAYDAWVTPFQATLGADLKYLEGPWFYYTTIAIADLVSNKITIEWLDGEILGSPELVTFDNDPPPQGEFFELLNFTPTLISCRGPGRSIAIASATNADPTVFTTTNLHGLITGQEVVISGATGGWTAVNATFEVTVVDGNEFSIDVDSTGFGALAGTLVAVYEDPSPGPFIAPAKPQNIEAFPIDLQFSSSPPETILGSVSAQGRIYLLTPNHLQIAQATPDQTVPILIRPFWKDGFAHPYQLVFLNGNLYGYTVGGPAKSIGEGDNIEAEKEWAGDMQELMQNWNPGQVLVAYDPFYDAIWFFHAADHLNEFGFWTTRILLWSPVQNKWIGEALLSQRDKDSIVSGVATVAEEIVWLMGGRRLG